MNRTTKVQRAKFEMRPEMKAIPKGKEVLCITTGEIFKSAKEAHEKYGIGYATLSACCRGEVKSCGGGKGKTKGMKFAYVADLAYKVNDVTEQIVELKAHSDKTHSFEERIKCLEEANRFLATENDQYKQTIEEMRRLMSLVG